MNKGHVIYTRLSALTKWDIRFLNMCDHIATWSKGPRHKIGCVIADNYNSIVSTGFNGPPMGYDDDAFLQMDRAQQLKIVLHAETNAIARIPSFQNTRKCTLYVSPLFPCKDCACYIAEKGFSRVVAYCGHNTPEWLESSKEGERILINAGVECIYAMEK